MNLNEKQEVIIKIDKKTGQLKTEVMGIKGTTCSTELNWVGKLGHGDSQNKPDYYQDNYQINEIIE